MCGVARSRLTLASAAPGSVSAKASRAMTTSRRASATARPTRDCRPLGGLSSVGLRAAGPSPRSAT
eukprot:581264-Alexandrium_andersonii.AAC.1